MGYESITHFSVICFSRGADRSPCYPVPGTSRYHSTNELRLKMSGAFQPHAIIKRPENKKADFVGRLLWSLHFVVKLH